MIETIIKTLDPQFLIQSLGLLGIFGIVFAESGLFFGFFLPGDSLLFVAGLLASQGAISLALLVCGVFIAAVLGDSFGYSFGYKVGRKFFEKEDSIIFKKRYLLQTESFFSKYGPKAIILARFIPIVRTFTPILAGVGKMKYGLFIKYNIIGGLGWTLILVMSGYFLGRLIPNIDKYLLPIVLLIIFISFAPAGLELWKNYKRRV